MTAPVGAVVGIYVDLRELVAIGDVIETTSGRRYRVLAARSQDRGKHVGRQHLRCIVVPGNWAPDAEPVPTVHRIRWYKRQASKRQARPGARRRP